MQMAQILVKLNQVPIEMEFDAGAAVSVISKKIWCKIGAPKLISARKIRAFGGCQIDTLGKCSVNADYKSQSKRLDVVVDAPERPLFGFRGVVGCACRYETDKMERSQDSFCIALMGCRFLNVDSLHIPTFEQMMNRVAGGEKYSIIDLKDAYFQIPVDKDTSRLLAISTT
ncbi:hypothetical protein ACOME3_002429 [Neoechinorhynchus agilis]